MYTWKWHGPWLMDSSTPNITSTSMFHTSSSRKNVIGIIFKLDYSAALNTQTEKNNFSDPKYYQFLSAEQNCRKKLS